MKRRALISVSDKRGVEDFARRLSGMGFEIISTGGTARALTEAGVKVVPVSKVTGAPEILGGRVKTLHPKIHGGILADPGKHNATGNHTVTASGGPGTPDGSATVPVWEKSGLPWVSRFPTSTSTADLAEPFRSNADSFIGALRAAGATVSISATLRPPERAYLMHYAWAIAHGLENPANVPAYSGGGVNICWLHYKSTDGTADTTASKSAAQDMIGRNGYNMSADAKLNSNHIQGLAIDMTISWKGTLNIREGTLNNGSGQIVSINTTPRSGGTGKCGEGNAQLRRVGETYGVLKLVSCTNPDPPHWSIDGH
jgi:hypothetical protein